MRIRIASLCVPKNLNADVVVMKSAKDRIRGDDSEPLNWARDWRILIQ